MTTYILTSNDMQIKDKLIWEKSNPMPRNRDRRYIANIEMASWYVKKDKWTFNRQSIIYDTSVLKFPVESGGGFERYHPNQKNIKMLEDIRKTRDLIIDPFMGSGSTGIACINTNRNFIGIEKDGKYFDIANSRIEKSLQQIKQVSLPNCYKT